jgi:hypothetical protein
MYAAIAGKQGHANRWVALEQLRGSPADAIVVPFGKDDPQLLCLETPFRGFEEIRVCAALSFKHLHREIV